MKRSIIDYEVFKEICKENVLNVRVNELGIFCLGRCDCDIII